MLHTGHATVLPVTMWYAGMLVDIGNASEVVLSSYMYDHLTVQSMMLRKLGNRACEPSTLIVQIDREAFRGSTPYYQKSRLTALRDAGARMLLCTGDKAGGIWHKKAVVVDRRYLYSGAANITNQFDAGEQRRAGISDVGGASH